MDRCSLHPDSICISKSPLHYGWREVLGVRVVEVVCGWNGIQGALYYDLGLILDNGARLNLTNPVLPFRRDSTTRRAELLDDYTEETVPLERVTGLRLKAMIRAVDGHGHGGDKGDVRGNYYAVLEDNHYLTTYSGFNHTVFGYGSFSRENRGRECRNTWSHLVPSDQEYRNAWTGDRIAPFSVYW